MALALVSGYHEVLWRCVLGGVKEGETSSSASKTPQSQGQTGGSTLGFSAAAEAPKSALDILSLGVIQAVLSAVGSGNPGLELGFLLQAYGRCTCGTPQRKGDAQEASGEASEASDEEGEGASVALSNAARPSASYQLTAAFVALRLLELCALEDKVESSHGQRAAQVLQQLLLPLLAAPRQRPADPTGSESDLSSTVASGETRGERSPMQPCGRCSSGLPPRSAAAQQVVEAITFLVSRFGAWETALHVLLPLCIRSLSTSTQDQPSGEESQPDLTLVPALGADLLSSLLSSAVLHPASPHSTPPVSDAANHSDEFLQGTATSLLEAWLGYTTGNTGVNGVPQGPGAKGPLHPEFESAVLPALAQTLADCEERPWEASIQAQWGPRVWGALKGGQLASPGSRNADTSGARRHDQEGEGQAGLEGQGSLAMLVLFSSFLLPLPKWYTDQMGRQDNGVAPVWDVGQDAAFWGLIKRALAHPDTLTRKRAMHLLLRALPSEDQISALAAHTSTSSSFLKPAPTEHPSSKGAGHAAGSSADNPREGAASISNGDAAVAHVGQEGSGKDKVPASDQGVQGSKQKHKKKAKRDRWVAQESQLGPSNKRGGAPEEAGQGSLLAHARAVCGRWKAFCLLLDTLDEFGLHLAEGVWQPQIDLLLPHLKLCVAGRSATAAAEEKPQLGAEASLFPPCSLMEAPDVDMEWMAIAWGRGFAHSNPQVRRLVLDSFLTCMHRVGQGALPQQPPSGADPGAPPAPGPGPLPLLGLPVTFITGPLLATLNDSQVHRDFGIHGNYSSSMADQASRLFYFLGSSCCPPSCLAPHSHVFLPDLLQALLAALLRSSPSRPGLMASVMALHAAAAAPDAAAVSHPASSLVPSEGQQAALLEGYWRLLEMSKRHFNPKYRCAVAGHVLRAAAASIPPRGVPLSALAGFLWTAPPDSLLAQGPLRRDVLHWLLNATEVATAPLPVPRRGGQVQHQVVQPPQAHPDAPADPDAPPGPASGVHSKGGHKADPSSEARASPKSASTPGEQSWALRGLTDLLDDYLGARPGEASQAEGAGERAEGSLAAAGAGGGLGPAEGREVEEGVSGAVLDGEVEAWAVTAGRWCRMLRVAACSASDVAPVAQALESSLAAYQDVRDRGDAQKVAWLRLGVLLRGLAKELSTHPVPAQGEVMGADSRGHTGGDSGAGQGVRLRDLNAQRLKALRAQGSGAGEEGAILGRKLDASGSGEDAPASVAGARIVAAGGALQDDRPTERDAALAQALEALLHKFMDTFASDAAAGCQALAALAPPSGRDAIPGNPPTAAASGATGVPQSGSSEPGGSAAETVGPSGCPHQDSRSSSGASASSSGVGGASWIAAPLLGALGGPAQRRLPPHLASAAVTVVCQLQTFSELASWLFSQRGTPSKPSSLWASLLVELAFRLISPRGGGGGQNGTCKQCAEEAAELHVAASEALSSIAGALRSAVERGVLRPPAVAPPPGPGVGHSGEQREQGSARPGANTECLLETVHGFFTRSHILSALTRSRRAVLLGFKWQTLDSLLAISLCCGQQPASPGGLTADLRFQEQGPAQARPQGMPIRWAPAPMATLQALLEEGIDELEGVEEERMLPLLRSLRSFISLGLLSSVPSWRHTSYGPGDVTAVEVMRSLVQAAWASLEDCHKRRVAPLAALISTAFHPLAFPIAAMHTHIRGPDPSSGPGEDAAAEPEGTAAAGEVRDTEDAEAEPPLRWMVDQLMSIAERSPRTMRMLALHLTGLWKVYPCVATLYLPQLLHLSLHGADVVDEELDGEIAESSASGEEYARLAASADPELAEVFTNSEMYARVCVGILMHHFAPLTPLQQRDSPAPAPGAAPPQSLNQPLVHTASATHTERRAHAPGPSSPHLCHHSAAEERGHAQACGQGLLMDLLQAVVYQKDLAKELYKKKSAIHRRKVRAWQMLSILTPFLAPHMLHEAMPLYEMALERNNMPSVRQFIEVHGVLVILRFPHLARAWLVPLLEDVNRKNQALSSYVIIATHVCLHARPRAQQEALVAALLPATVPYLTTHHHNLRTFTQVLVWRLLAHFPHVLHLEGFHWKGDPPAAPAPRGASEQAAGEQGSCTQPLPEMRGDAAAARGTATEAEREEGSRVAGRALLRGLHHFLDRNADCARLRAAVEKYVDAFDPVAAATPRGMFLLTGGVPEEDSCKTVDGLPFECVPVAVYDHVVSFLTTAREQLRGTMAAESAQLDLEAALGPEGGPQGGPNAPGTRSQTDGASTGEGRSARNGDLGPASSGRDNSGGSAGSRRGSGPPGWEDEEGEGGGSGQLLNWDFQKKIDRINAVPSGGAAPGGGELEGEAEEERLLVRHVEGRAQALAALTAARQSVIVVAAFVSRVPNLAGLARTCEVFKAEAMVVADASVTADRQFQLISVTAERWVPVVEVPEERVREYLLGQRRRGYHLVGLEQTANSSPIHKTQLPERLVIVLGREKEGIPVPIIQILDQCVEIPQLGLIRSLNVHVSGALALWEYTRQHLK